MKKSKIEDDLKKFFYSEFEKSKFNMFFGGVLSLLGHPLYYFIYTYIYPQNYDSFVLRFTSSIISIPLLFSFKIGDKYKIFMSVYWYIWATYILPFTFTYIMLMNNASPLWMIAETMMIFLLMLFISNVFSAIILLFIGCYLSSLLFIFNNNYLNLSSGFHLSEYIALLPLAISCSILLLYGAKRGEVERQKSKIFKSLSGSIAHELRNPLNVINIVGSHIKDSLKEFDKLKDLQNQFCNAHIALGSALRECPTNDCCKDGILPNNCGVDFASKANICDDNKSNNSALSKVPEFDNSQQKIIEIIDTIKNQLIENTQHISSAINNANNIINIILSDLSEKEIDESEFVLINSHDIINKAINEYGFKNENERLKLLTDLTASISFIIKAIPERLTYILFNLIKNSLYYLQQFPSANIVIGVEAGKIIDDIKYNIIFVRDTGPGVPSDILPKLFDDFFTSGKKGGTGLGLSFCKRNMRIFNGDIICESEFGGFNEKGEQKSGWTKFSLLFPLVENGDKLFQEQKEEERSLLIKNMGLRDDNFVDVGNKKFTTEEINKIFKNRKFILADDQDLNRKITKKILEKYGADVVEVINGKDLLEAYKQNINSGANSGFDAILTDINMPPYNGDEAVIEIRKIEKELSNENHLKSNLEATPKANSLAIPIVALTGDGAKEVIKKFLENGFDYCFVKGSDSDQLVQAIANLLVRK